MTREDTETVFGHVCDECVHHGTCKYVDQFARTVIVTDVPQLITVHAGCVYFLSKSSVQTTPRQLLCE